MRRCCAGAGLSIGQENAVNELMEEKVALQKEVRALRKGRALCAG